MSAIMPLSQRQFGSEDFLNSKRPVRTIAPMILALMAGGFIPVTMA